MMACVQVQSISLTLKQFYVNEIQKHVQVKREKQMHMHFFSLDWAAVAFLTTFSRKSRHSDNFFTQKFPAMDLNHDLSRLSGSVPGSLEPHGLNRAGR